jgi:hypothetical protein
MGTRILAFTTTLLVCGSAFAQTNPPALHSAPTVYKCTDASGSVVFSDAPCPSTSKAQKVDTSAALRTGSGGSSGEIAAKVADSDCRGRAQQSSNANAAQIAESNQHIADYQKRQQELAGQKAYAADGSGAMVDDPNARQEISKLDDAIAKERSYQDGLQKTSSAAYDAAIKACDAQAKSASSQSDAKVK